ncbi:MAG TPA: regulatory protein RecX [Flexivirga sp.]|uniref:regulatory protein RecX n=1 Tax=Flexivirga sp. TaxID=1962927 RepID=UPI002B6184C7|nr:regulatory protein RecX [Flexivirga sp.]HWC20968.1 regulatory protein RecX [Flexivirga sp.]
MNPFDSAPDSPPDFVDPADVIVGPWAGSGAQGPTPGRDEGADRGRDRGARRPSPRGGGATSRAAGTTGGRRSPRQARDDREPPPDKQGPDADPHEVARTIVLRQLAAAPRSRKQLADKLRERGCDDDIAASVLDRLEQVGLIDDAAYAATMIQSQQTRRGLGRQGISQELRRKGVASEVIDEQLESIDDDDERERARALVDKKLRSMHGLDATVQARRLAGMLARKGYSSSIAWSVIREAIADAPEHQPD